MLRGQAFVAMDGDADLNATEHDDCLDLSCPTTVWSQAPRSQYLGTGDMIDVVCDDGGLHTMAARRQDRLGSHTSAESSPSLGCCGCLLTTTSTSLRGITVM